MLLYQLEAAIVLVVAAVLSLALFVLLREKEGKIQLPEHQHDEVLGGEDGVAEEKHDPFNVVTHEDIIEGYPLEDKVDGFWHKIRLWKICSTLLVGGTLIVEGASLGWAAMSGTGTETTTFTLRVVFAFYVLVASIFTIPHQEPQKHSQYIINLGSLTSFAAFVLFCTAIVPSTFTTSAPSQSSVPNGLWITSTCMYILTCISYITIPMGPPLHYPVEQIYSPKVVESITNMDRTNVAGVSGASIVDYLFFSYNTKVVKLGNTAASVEIGDLPIIPANIRATWNYRAMSNQIKRPLATWLPKFNAGSGFKLGVHLILSNKAPLLAEMALAAVAGALFYVPAIFMKGLISYVEDHPDRSDVQWGWFYVVGVFISDVLVYLITGQLWSLATTIVAVRIKVQVNSILFKKTLIRKDVAGASTSSDASDSGSSQKRAQNGDANGSGNGKDGKSNDEEDDFATKGQIFTLFTTDADRVSDVAWHLFALVDAPIEIAVGTIFLYNLLGVSCLFGLLVICLFLPLNHWASKVVVKAQDNLMKKRDERVALMNEILGAIRMLKFMAWERSFETRVLKIRDQELRWQRLNYTVEALFNFLWGVLPIVVAVVSFWHYAVFRGEPLTPAVAFTSILVFTELKYALSVLPETLISLLQCLVSLRRVEKYLSTPDVTPVPPLAHDYQSLAAPSSSSSSAFRPEQSKIAFTSCTVTWPQDRSARSNAPSVASTPRQKFVLVDLNLQFPRGELSLVCGKLGSGKTLLLLALLGESDVLTGQVLCPRSPPDVLAALSKQKATKRDWVVEGVCAYVPQMAWLRNASIKENILFNLPFDAERYQKTLEVCALTSDLEILEDGDESEIGERGVNLSGGQKARVSLARAVYSRASILLLDDVLSAVDAHTASHLYHQCLKGELMRDRTVILISHHVQLCAPGAKYVVALDNGHTMFVGDGQEFSKGSVIAGLIQSDNEKDKEKKDETEEAVLEGKIGEAKNVEETIETAQGDGDANVKKERKPARKLVEEEKRAVGRISRDIYSLYILSLGRHLYWTLFLFAFLIATLAPVADNSWLRYWSNAVVEDPNRRPATFYIGIYAAVTITGAVVQTIRWFVLYYGSIQASVMLYKNLLEAVLFANIRFHDTVSRGRLLNRFGKDFEGIDSSMADNFGRTFGAFLSALTTLITVTVVGGPLFLVAAVILGTLYYDVGKMYGQASRDMRRLDSVTRSPLYSLYGETISGVAIIRGFGASSKFLRDMLQCVDTNVNPFYWMWGVNRWISIRFNMLSSAIVGATAAVCILNGSISAAFTGFVLTFANSISSDLLFTTRRFVNMEQSMVALERVKEYSDLPPEPPEFQEPRPPTDWPPKGSIKVEDLVIRYAPELPDVLHNLDFEVQPGQKIGILGRTGSGKSTLALSFFRFVEATKGRILVDNIDIANVGLTDLRSRLTIIPQDPTILSGTLRSTLDVFDEYEDAELYEALRRVHLIPSGEVTQEEAETVNANVFRNLDSPVSEGGENFSTGEKQLMCMARAVLRRTKLLVMDEATASVDYHTDQLISNTIREAFSDSTILTIAHRLRTVIDYDKVMLLDQGAIIEFDKPATLLRDPNSKFSSLCKATGKEEFSVLKKMAGA